MKAIDHHLYDRGGRYYYRASFPRTLRPFIPFKEVKLSLATSDIGQARLYVARLDIEVERLISDIYSTLEDSPTAEGLEIIKEQIEGCYDRLRLTVGLTNIRQSPHWYSSAVTATKQSTQSLRLSDISEEYLKECITNTKRTIEQKRVAYELFIAIIGDIPLNKIKREQARKYKSTLLEMPVSILKRKGYSSYADVNWSNLPEGKKQSYETINSKIIPLASLLTWAEKNDLYRGSNPFSGLLIKEVKHVKNKRVPYKNNELNRLFTCPIYRGCKGVSIPQRLEVGSSIYKDYLYWIPLVGLYSGMRLNEICQLEVEDIEENDGVWCFNINDRNGKSLKTVSSHRIIPIHHKLIDLGFIDYAQQQAQGRIFHDLDVAYNGSYSYSFTKRYSRLLVKLSIKKKGLCFHSFRHTFIDALRNAGVERSITMKLAGHGSSNDIHNNYGYGYNFSVLQEAVNKLSFPILEK